MKTTKSHSIKTRLTHGISRILYACASPFKKTAATIKSGKLKPSYIFCSGGIIAAAGIAAIIICVFPEKTVPATFSHAEALAVPAMLGTESVSESIESVMHSIYKMNMAPPKSIVDEIMDDYSTLEYGMEDGRVETLQRALVQLGFLSLEETTLYYGPATKQAVMIFQRQHHLEKTGIADEATLMFIFSGRARKYRLALGDEGSDVRELQLQLADLAYADKITGYYGDATAAAVRDFQERNSLDITGIADSDTIEMLYMPNAVPGENYTHATKRRAKILAFVDYAKKQLGKRYSLGSTGPNYFDCSGLVYYCLREAGSNRRRLSAQGYSQVSDWERFDNMDNLEIGDLLFFYGDSWGRVGHVGIYVGGGDMIDASFSKGIVVRRSCKTAYWTRRFVCARRPW